MPARFHTRVHGAIPNICQNFAGCLRTGRYDLQHLSTRCLFLVYRASHLRLDKNTGRGTALHTRLYVKKIPVFYTPWFNFRLIHDDRPVFLMPSIGTSNISGGIFRAPFIRNIAPAHDATITPVIMTKRGLQVTGLFAILAPTILATSQPLSCQMTGHSVISRRPCSKKYGNSTDPTIQSEASMLSRASETRKALVFHHDARLSDRLTTTIRYNRRQRRLLSARFQQQSGMKPPRTSYSRKPQPLIKRPSGNSPTFAGLPDTSSHQPDTRPIILAPATMLSMAPFPMRP